MVAENCHHNMSLRLLAHYSMLWIQQQHRNDDSCCMCPRTRSKKEEKKCQGGKEETQGKKDKIKVRPKWEEEESVLCKLVSNWFKPMSLAMSSQLTCFHLNLSIICVPSQSEDDFLDESDFDDISIHSASVLSDALRATTKKKTKSGQKKKKSMLTACWRFCLSKSQIAQKA